MKSNPDAKTAGSSYILSFYDDVMTLTSLYANYQNVLLDLQNISETDDNGKPKLNETQENILNEIINKTRFYVIVCEVKYYSIMSNIFPDKKESIAAQCAKITAQPIINLDDLKILVQDLNNALINEVVVDLLASAQKTISAVYQS